MVCLFSWLPANINKEIDGSLFHYNKGPCIVINVFFIKVVLFASMKANDENCFLFQLKSSFHSQDIYIFVLIFWSCREIGLIRKIRLISITIHILPNISRSKGNQTIKFGQVIEYNKRNIFKKIIQKMRQRD